MADPLSFTASLIAVIGTAVAVGRTVNRLLHSIDSVELLTLKNEISDLTIVLQEVELLCKEKDSREGTWSNTLAKSLEQVNGKLMEVEEMAGKLIKRSRAKKAVKVVRRLSRKDEAMIAKVKDEIRDAKLNILTMISVENLSGLGKVALSIQELQFSSRETLRQLSFFTQQKNNTGYSKTPESNQQEGLQEIIHCVNTGSQSSSQSTSYIAIQAVRCGRLLQGSCTPWCSCACHKKTRWKSPPVLTVLFGALFIKLAGVPALTPACTEDFCKQRKNLSASVVYVFPSWLLMRMISMMVMYTPLNGPEASLRVRRVVPGDAEVFRLATMGDDRGLTELFESQMASPNDINGVTGRSALHYAIGHARLTTCRLLLDAGADPYIENVYQTSAIDYVWTFILGCGTTTTQLLALKALFPDESILEEREFPPLHKLILGLHSPSPASSQTSSPTTLLETQLQLSTSQINTTDSKSKSALTWSSQRVDYPTVRTLLSYGANPNIKSISGNSPLHFAVRGGSLKVVRILVAAGAEVNRRDRWGKGALWYAFWLKDWSAYIEPLAVCDEVSGGLRGGGEEVEDKAVKGFEFMKGHAMIARFLIENGADWRGCVHESGWTPLLISIFWREYGLLGAILSGVTKEDFEAKTKKGWTILHVLARYGDLGCLELLRDWLVDGVMDFQEEDNGGAGIWDLLARRESVEKGFREVFFDLRKWSRDAISSSDGSAGTSGNSQTGSDGSENDSDDEERFFDAVEHQQPNFENGFSGVKEGWGTHLVEP